MGGNRKLANKGGGGNHFINAWLMPNLPPEARLGGQPGSSISAINGVLK